MRGAQSPESNVSKGSGGGRREEEGGRKEEGGGRKEEGGGRGTCSQVLAEKGTLKREVSLRLGPTA